MGDKGRQGETRGDKTSRRRKRHQADKPSQAHMWGVTMGDKKGRQDVVKADAPANTGTRARRQWETIGSMGDKGRQDLGKADDKGRQDRGKGNTPSKTCRHTCEETMGDKGRRVDKTSGRPTHHPTQAHMCRRQWETKRKDKMSKRRTHHPTQAHVRGGNGRQWGAMGGKTPASRTHHPTRENKKGHHGRQRENPTKGNKKEQNGRQKETSPSERRTYHPTRGNKKDTMGDKGRQDPRQGGHTIQQGEPRRTP